MAKGKSVYILERTLKETISGEGFESEILGVFASKTTAVWVMGDRFDGIKQSFIDAYVKNTHLSNEKFEERASFDCETPFLEYVSADGWESNYVRLEVKEFKLNTKKVYGNDMGTERI